jgi:hypothetical protein
MRRSAGGVPFPTETTSRSAALRRMSRNPSAAMTVSAAVSSMASASSPLSLVATICVVMVRNPPPNTYGALNEASAVRNVSSAAPVSAGPSSGSVTRRKVRHGPAPSEAAASSMEASMRARPARVNR